jgi:PAS domain-containing protein
MTDPVEALKYVSDGVATLDREWRFTYVNGRAALLFRRKEEELLGRTWWEAFPQLADTPSAVELRSAMGSTMARRARMFHPQLYAWHEVQAVPSAGGLLLVIRDVTDEARLQQTEAVRSAVREIFEQVPLAVSVLRGAEQRVEIMNAASRQVLGGRNVEGRPVRTALPELEGQGLFELLDTVYETGRPFEGKEVHVRYDKYGDGTLHEGYFNILYQPLFDSTGRVNGVLSISVEVTELVRQRDEVERRSAEQLAVLGQLLEGVVITDAAGRVTFVNEAAERLLGTAVLDVGPEDYVSAYGVQSVDGAPFDPTDLPLVRAVRRDEVVTGTRWRIRRPDGTEVVIEGNARPVFVADGTKVAAVLTVREVESEA